uniref:Si:dkey-237j11.3 n=1 Tax=Seriola dumerili TaxID=41447 RepID=A0A3B4TT17_SERDU
MVFLTLAICLQMGHQTFARNDAPCQRGKWNNSYNTFVKRHIRSGTPTSLDQNQWENYIRNNGGCERPTQSFLQPKDLERVKAVCTNSGGKRYKENLCISDQPFKFVTVRSVQGTCGIKSVREESKHLILKCFFFFPVQLIFPRPVRFILQPLGEALTITQTQS